MPDIKAVAQCPAGVLVCVRLTRKLANVLNGVDVSRFRVGDCFDLPARDARMLIAEGWAELVDTRHHGDDDKPQNE